MNADALKALVAGVVAAPEGFERDGWMRLVSAETSAKLVAELRALASETRKRFDDGLETVPAPPLRLDAVRLELAKRDLDAFIVPRADEQQNEYVPRAGQRLRWLTGFSGSAGTAMVSKDKATVFVDGRYTAQVTQEVNLESFTYRHLVDQPLTEWITSMHQEGDRIGYDPWLHTSDDVMLLNKACDTIGATLVACDSNVIDAVWLNRAPAPISPVRIHGEERAGKSSLEKRLELGKLLSARACDATVLSAADSIAWLLNVRGGDLPSTPFTLGYAIALADSSVDLYIDTRKLTPPVRDHLGSGVRVHPLIDLNDGLKALENKRVMIDPALTPYAIVRTLENAKARLSRDGDPVQLPKAQKNLVEVNGARAAHLRDAVAMVHFLAWLDTEAPKGVLDELSVSAKLREFRQRDSLFRDESFETIAGAGPNGAIVHYRSTPRTNRKLENPSIFLCDSGGQYEDGTTDITRVIAIGRPTDEQKDRFTRVLKGHIAIATARFPIGTTGSQLDTLARQPLWAIGLDFDHGTGHGVGSYLSVHEGPQRISKIPNRVALRPGMIVSNEPGYYNVGGYGIRIETLVKVDEKRPTDERDMLHFETLTLVPIDTRLVETAMLTEHERNWFNAYHARVRESVRPLVAANHDVTSWLDRATEPV
ncbi:MAG: aminopeptidase P family protein [Clostridia bacterium]|nr:aminopeptidase P family protein [Deltaproteobacteria bacterium]